MLQTTCKELAVSLYPCGGFSSATLCYEAALEIDAADRARAVVLFLGDFDPAGVLIDGHVEAELRHHLARRWCWPPEIALPDCVRWLPGSRPGACLPRPAVRWCGLSTWPGGRQMRHQCRF